MSTRGFLKAGDVLLDTALISRYFGRAFTIVAEDSRSPYLSPEGVWEKDPIRGEDSFEAFEEVLFTATDLAADAVLLGGDLFHDNKPSRSTLVKAIKLITKHCLNDSPVSFQILSDQTSNFVSGQVNYMDPNLNVGLPIFTIHGNHDDPSGSDNLSAVDILSSCKLVNYFGKQHLGGVSGQKLSISPVLIKKGNTRLALYGLGSIRDERLCRLFAQSGMVSWCRPQPTPDVGLNDWVNLMVLHQNRVERGVQSKNSVQEAHLPAFLDVVVWGHEHECKPDLEDLRNPEVALSSKSSKVLQPGSSVVTSLSEGESRRKHLFLLEVKGNAYRVVKYPMTSVRPFVFETIALKDQPVRAEDPDSITACLEAKVTEMIARALHESPPEAGVAPKLPLIRLRVDYTGFSTINAQRFGQRFVNKVANPQDLLIWHKAAVRRTKIEGRDEEGDDVLRPEALDQQRIEDLVASNLQASLRVLHEEDLAVALHNFVEKDDKQALHDLVTKSLLETAMPMLANMQKLDNMGDNDVELVEAVEACVQLRRDAKASASAAGLDPLAAIPMTGGINTAGSAGAVTPAFGGLTIPYQQRVLGRDIGGGDEIEDGDGIEGATGALGATIPMGPSVSAKPPKGGTTRTKATKSTPASAAARGARGGGRGGAKTGARQPSLFEAFARSASQPQASAAASPKSVQGGTQGSAMMGAGTRRVAVAHNPIDHDDDDVIEEADPGGSVLGPSRTRALRGRNKRLRLDSDDEAGLSDDGDAYVGGSPSDDDNLSDASLVEEGGDSIEESDEEDVAPSPRRKQAAGRSRVPKKRSANAKDRAKPASVSKAVKTQQPTRAGRPSANGMTGGDAIFLDDDEEGGVLPPIRMPATAMPIEAPQGAATQQGATQASVGGRKRPASFLQATQQTTKPATKPKNWGAAA